MKLGRRRPSLTLRSCPAFKRRTVRLASRTAWVSRRGEAQSPITAIAPTRAVELRCELGVGAQLRADHDEIGLQRAERLAGERVGERDHRVPRPR